MKDEETKDIIEVPQQEVVINPKQQIARAREVAEACKDIVKQKSVIIQGRRHVEVEGWQTIAVGHGCVLSAKDVTKVDNGYSAIGEVRRISDGIVIATGEGFVGDDEENWEGRPLYARKAMAQTRGMSRAGRSAFGYVVVLMGDDFSATPAEEMTGVKPKEEMKGCPICGEKAVIKGKAEYGGGYVCWKKRGGCGTKFDDNMLPITEFDDNMLPIANVKQNPKITQEEAEKKLENLSDRVKEYFVAKSFTKAQQWDFCEKCEWINEKMVGAIISEEAFGSDETVPPFDAV